MLVVCAFFSMFPYVNENYIYGADIVTINYFMRKWPQDKGEKLGSVQHKSE